MKLFKRKPKKEPRELTLEERRAERLDPRTTKETYYGPEGRPKK